MLVVCHLKVDDLGVEVPLKLHGQLSQLVHPKAGGMNTGGEEELAIRGGFHAMTCSRKLQVLYELNLSPAGTAISFRIVKYTNMLQLLLLLSTLLLLYFM